ncbi:hypothetical protein FD754_022636 [Muntiacus muntjak]|uniref:Ubiquitin-like-conjugating enzyme ATG10 n=1 Tax=Muntiacus muntjak TaxID=9888 RepID=A0A5N3VBA9_MUNMU|nr:hypothetical protein FD754_022636 [Muntiacus muntjak]
MEEDEFFGEKTFQHYCAKFIEPSQKIGDGWEWRTSKDCSDGYICRTHFQVKNGTAMSHQGISAHVQTFLPTTTAAKVIKYEYHVIYSCSYQNIWEGVHECYKMWLLQGPWAIPLLGYTLRKPKLKRHMYPIVHCSTIFNN